MAERCMVNVSLQYVYLISTDVWIQFQYQDRPSIYVDFHHKDETNVRQFYFYNRNIYTG